MTNGRVDAVQEAQGWLANHGAAAETAAETAVGDDKHGPPLRPPTVGGVRANDGPDADAEAVARSIALRKLTGQARTRRELEQALAGKGVPAEAAEAVLDRLEVVGLVDDAAFAEGWVASRQQRRHLSRGALRRELHGKGVNSERIESALEAVDSDDEHRAALALVDKKLRSLSGLDAQVRYRRLAGALGRRGFGSGVIRAVLAERLGGGEG